MTGPERMTGPEPMKSPGVVLSKLSPRTILPVAVVGFVAVVGLLMIPAAAQASRSQASHSAAPESATDAANVVRQQVAVESYNFDSAVLELARRDHESVGRATTDLVSYFNQGMSRQTKGAQPAVTLADHTQSSGSSGSETPVTNPDVGYGVPPGTPGSPISYSLPPSSYIAPGRTLFEENCSSCHGTEATGSAIAPDLQGLGAGTIDFWVSTGRMPLANASESAVIKPPKFNPTQILQIVAFVNSLLTPTPGNIAIPTIDLSGANLENGNALFVLNCAACHTITGSGDAIAGNNYAPTLHTATAYQAVEAMRSGPGNMPRFGPGTLTDQQVADIVAYVTGPIQHPANHGGLGLGGIGPVAEGFIALLIGVGGLMLVAYWLGDRTAT
jgi:ubiquinol-cytochrome c reductase cytochrome c subunit